MRVQKGSSNFFGCRPISDIEILLETFDQQRTMVHAANPISRKTSTHPICSGLNGPKCMMQRSLIAVSPTQIAKVAQDMAQSIKASV
jgi:hypothetical protein